MIQYNSHNIRKLEACIRIYGALSERSSPAYYVPAKTSLGKMLTHRYPAIRGAAVDELWARLDSDQDVVKGGHDGVEGAPEVDTRSERQKLRGFDWVRERKDALAKRAGEVCG